jgi:Flp pilus assembly protein TadD
LAALDSSQGRFAEAEARLRQALDLVARRGQNGSAAQAVALNGLGITYLRWRRFDDAIEAFSPALALWVKWKGADSITVGVTGYNLALA